MGKITLNIDENTSVEPIKEFSVKPFKRMKRGKAENILSKYQSMGCDEVLFSPPEVGRFLLCRSVTDVDFELVKEKEDA